MDTFQHMSHAKFHCTARFTKGLLLSVVIATAGCSGMSAPTE